MSELTTQRTEEKIKLKDLTSESVLSKEYSRRNFRIKTLATAQEEPFEDPDRDYDESSEMDFLKFNRKLVKKTHKATETRARIKTRPF